MNARIPGGYTEAVERAIVSPQRRYAFPGSASEASTVLRHSFSVAGEPVGLQMAAWRDYVGRTLDVPLSRTQVAQGFVGEIHTWVLRDLVFMDGRTDPLAQARTVARISTDSVRDFVFHIAVEGIVETSTGSSWNRKASQFEPGILALDMGQPMRMLRPVRSRIQAFFVPRHVVEAAIPDAESLHGSTLGYNKPLSRLLPRQLALLRNDLSAMAPAEAERCLRASLQLILAAFARQRRLGGGARAAARAAMQVQIEHYIQSRLYRKELSPELILATFPVSRPTLYRMFEDDGGLFAYIRHCRLREAANELAGSTTSIARIADGLGFGSPSDFTRAFRRSYDTSPLDFRAQGLEWLLPQ